MEPSPLQFVYLQEAWPEPTSREGGSGEGTSLQPPAIDGFTVADVILVVGQTRQNLQ